MTEKFIDRVYKEKIVVTKDYIYEVRDGSIYKRCNPKSHKWSNQTAKKI